MKYGTAFATLSLLFAIYAISSGGWSYLLLWPSVSFALVTAAYFGVGTRIYGKLPDGTLPLFRRILLLPFLAYLSLVWHVLRLFSREPPFSQLTDNVYIGRRLLSSERPPDFDHIIDLTCEFTESHSLRSAGYVSFPILDGDVPAFDALEECVSYAATLEGIVYIHCAQGHGRTATFASAYLLHTKLASTVDEAVNRVLECRPAAGLGRLQRSFLDANHGGG